MNTYLLIKYLHFLGIFGVVGALATELFLTKPSLSREEVSRLAKIDGAYGVSTMIVLAAGFTLWFAVGKPAAFYSGNWIFISKLVLFGCIGGLSVWPTVFFVKSRNGSSDTVEVPKSVRVLIRLEVILLMALPLLAVLMANGIGAF